MITIATHLWEPNDQSFAFSRCYNESWVEKLYRGFERNLTEPFRFICLSEHLRDYAEPAIIQGLFRNPAPSYSDCIELFRLNCPMIICGLDTVVTGNCDALADYCLTADKIALPRDPNALYRACNGVVCVPAGKSSIWTDHNGENDMAWMRRQPHEFIDDLFPGQVRSYKGGVHPGARDAGIGDARIVYLHGEQKMHQFEPDNPLLAHWI